MADLAEKLSILVKDQLPDFIRDSYDTFQAFLIAYYEFTEQNTEVQYAIQKSESYKDIDETIDSFVDYFIKDYAYNLPNSVFLNQQFQDITLTDSNIESKRAFAKHLLEYHSAKGSEGAAKLLFRLLFDDEITFYYPKDDLLKPSDGTWQTAKTIHLYDDVNSNILVYAGSYAEGVESEAIAVLDGDYSVKSFPSSNLIYEMSIDNSSLSGTFVLGEQIAIKSANATTGNLEIVKTVKALNVISSVTIIDGGVGYTKGSIIFDGSTAVGLVSAVTSTGKIKEIGVIQPTTGTSNYNANSVVSLTISGTPLNYSGKFESNSNVAVIVLFDDTGNSIPHSFTTADTINVQFTSGIIADANLYTVNSVLSSKRFTIANVNISDSQGNVTIIAQPANLKPVIGVVANYSGVYIDKGGHISDIKKIHDSDYYQEYSYVIRANQSSQYWADIIKKALHPAGMKLFSEVYLTSANSIVSVSVLPENGIYQTLLRFLKLLITEPPIVLPFAHTMTVKLSSFARLSRDSRYRIGSTYKTLDNFKFEYENLQIYDVGNLTLQFLSENIDEPILFAPPSQITITQV
jgi:hypothetical protein